MRPRERGLIRQRVHRVPRRITETDRIAAVPQKPGIRSENICHRQGIDSGEPGRIAGDHPEGAGSNQGVCRKCVTNAARDHPAGKIHGARAGILEFNKLVDIVRQVKHRRPIDVERLLFDRMIMNFADDDSCTAGAGEERQNSPQYGNDSHNVHIRPDPMICNLKLALSPPLRTQA